MAAVSGEKKVVLGLVTTKRPELEDKGVFFVRLRFGKLDKLLIC